MFFDGSFLFRGILFHVRNIPVEKKCYPISGLGGKDS